MKAITCMRATIDSLLKSRIARGGFDKNFDKVQIVSAEDGRCSASLSVDRYHCNVRDALHGGMAASLVDMVSTMALLTQDVDKPGVSVDLSVSFTSSGACGRDVLVNAVTLKRGRSMAFLNVDIVDKDTGKLIATGRHTKYMQ